MAAFAPHPMPDELALDHAAIRLMSDAEHAIGRLVGAVRRTVNPFLVGSPLLHREVTGRKRGRVFVAHEILKFMGKR